MNKIPVMEIIEKLDEYLNKNQEDQGKIYLEDWCEKAKGFGDFQGELTLLNELMGLNRKLGNSRDGMEVIERGFFLIKHHNLQNAVGSATIYLNGATALKSFGKAKEGLEYYKLAEDIYKNKGITDGRLGALYNNMALAYSDVNDKEKAKELFYMALSVVKAMGNLVLEEAMTYLNIADLLEITDLDNQSEIDDLINKAYSCFEDDKIEKNGYFAFVCSKCAPSFGHYGYFQMKKNLESQAEEIYARNRDC